MNFNQKHALAALITVTLIASGCASGANQGEDEEASSAPISVNEFSSFPNPAPTESKVTFRLSLENTGSVDAENVLAKLWNPPFAETNSDDRVWRDESGGGVTVPDRTFNFETLEATDEGLESFPEEKTLRLTSPNIDQEFPYNFFAKIYYQYRTEGSTTLTVTGGDAFREEGGSRSQTVDISHNDAPISLEGRLLSGNPIVYYPENDGAQKTVEFCVIVNNAGGGDVFLRDARSGGSNEYVVEDDSEDKLELSVQVLGNTGVSLPGQDNFDNQATETVDLIGGDNSRQCFDLRVQSLADAGSQKEIGPINVVANYGYSKDVQRQVTVNPR